MEFSYKPEGVCSSKYIISINDETKVINWVKIIGGCAGNTKGICNLVKGMKVDDVIEN